MRCLMRLSVAAVLLFVAACGHRIGDTCNRNVDCSPLGDRYCDISAPGGYCTIEGCDTNSCPSEAACVRFFEPIPSEPCDLAAFVTGCSTAERCLCDCGDDPARPGRCLPSMQVQSTTGGGVKIVCGAGAGSGSGGAHCAPESSERRFCQLTCANNGDCRDSNYECRQTGALGSQAVPDHTVTLGCDGAADVNGDAGCFPATVPVGPSARFCVQRQR